MPLRKLFRLTQALQPLSQHGWDAINILLDHKVIPWCIYTFWQRARERDYLAKDRAYHWHDTIQYSRRCMIGLKGYGERGGVGE